MVVLAVCTAAPDVLLYISVYNQNIKLFLKKQLNYYSLLQLQMSCLPKQLVKYL